MVQRGGQHLTRTVCQRDWNSTENICQREFGSHVAEASMISNPKLLLLDSYRLQNATEECFPGGICFPWFSGEDNIVVYAHVLESSMNTAILSAKLLSYKHATSEDS